MKLKRLSLVLLVLALLAGAAAGVGAKIYIEDTIATYRAELDARYRPVKVAVAAADLPSGTLLDASNVVGREVPAEFLHADAIPVDQWRALQGRLSRTALTRGAPILRAQLADERLAGLAEALQQGKRALTVPVDQVSSISGMLSPGDSIDLLLTLAREGEPLTFPLMKSLTVLATGVHTEQQSGPRSGARRADYNTVTLLVTPVQASRLVHAQEVGTLTVVLRGRDDPSDGWPDRTTIASLLGETPPAPPEPVKRSAPRSRVQVILGGQGENVQ